MDARRAAALLPALSLALGSALPALIGTAPVAAGATLTAAGMALGGPAGRIVLGFGVGFWRRGAQRAREAPRIDRQRPVTLLGRPEGRWRREREGWSIALRVLRLRQGPRVELWRQRVFVHLAGEEAAPPAALLLRLSGYLRRSHGYANPPPVPPGPWRLRVKSRRFVVPAGEGPLPARLSHALRQRTEEALGRLGTTLATPFVRALVLGDPSSVPQAWRRALRRAGLSHLLAVSGLHVALVAAVPVMAGLWLPRRTRGLLALTAVALYGLIVGPRPSLIRAALMATAVIASLLFERPPQSLHNLAWVAAGLLLVEPQLIGDLGFVLTVSATAGILIFGPSLARRWHRLPLPRALGATVAAQLFTLPWSAPAFHLVAPWSPLANLVAIPWIGLVLTVSLLAVATAIVSVPVARGLTVFLDRLVVPVEWLSAAPTELLRPLPTATSTAAALVASTAAGLLLLRSRTAAVLMAAVMALAWPDADGPGDLELTMIDVGQGEAILLRDGGEGLLIDGGGWSDADIGGRVILPALTRLGVGRLHALVLTHPDRDHCAGLVDIADYLPAREVWLAPGWRNEPCVHELLTIPRATARILWAGEGASFRRWQLTALHPAAGDHGHGNDRSLVLMAEALGRRFLLTGDLEAAGEASLVARYPAAKLRADVLKLAHHGSRTSTGYPLLGAARPRLALISAGIDNPYGHPSGEVLKRLAERRIPVLRTDRDGMIRLRLAVARPMRIELPGAPRRR